MSPDMIMIAIGGLAFVAIAGLGMVFAGGGNEVATKRAKAIGENVSNVGGGRRAKDDPNAARRKQTQQMLNKLKEQDSARKKSKNARDIKTRLGQAGLSMPPMGFYILSAVSCLLVGGLVYSSGLHVRGLTIMGLAIPGPAMLVAGLVMGFFGIPNFVLGTLIKRRTKKLTQQFADAIDIIVRGVKSGLPLTECLRIIAKESPQPLGGEFLTLTDNIQMGTQVDTALQKMYARVPLPEVNFFVIVLTIQAKAGGNLSEALGNLSNVIRQRKMMREKVKAMSSEAKASGMIIGVLPFAVGGMVFVTTPDYIMELFTNPMGHNILGIGAALYATGVTIMRNMINFDI